MTPEALQVLERIGLPRELALSTFSSARIINEHEDMFKHITEYIKNGQEHGYGIKLLNIVRLVRDGDMEFHHMPSCKDEFRMMLWHGTKSSHISSILKSSFLLSRHMTNMFGPGVRSFAD